MKKINTILLWSLAALMLGMSSCYRDSSPEPVTGQPEETVDLPLNISTKDLGPESPEALKFDLYVFRATGGTPDFKLIKTAKGLSNGVLVAVPAKNISTNDYRFLFIAEDESGGQISLLKGATTDQVDAGTPWGEVVLAGNDKLTLDNYYGVTNMTGNDILATGRIHGVLKRIAGQMVFDCFKTEGSLSTPIAVENTVVNSVFDRVFKAGITYSGLTERLSFDDSFELKPYGTTSYSVSQTIDFVLDEDNLRMPQEQTDNNILVNYGDIDGRVRLLCPVAFPATNSVRATMVFHYYDTTPTCGNKPGGTHTHDKDICFVTRTLVLNLPKDDMPGMSVYSNCFTVSKAGILLDRIIDIPRNAGAGIILDWNDPVPYQPNDANI